MEIDDNVIYDPRKVMLGLLKRVYSKNTTLFGSINNQNIRMPKKAKDGRKLTWTKLIDLYCGKILNKPQNQSWCWLVPANHSTGGAGRSAGWSCKHKISTQGKGNHQDVGKMFLMVLTNALFDDDEEYRQVFLPSMGDKPIVFGTINPTMPYYSYTKAKMNQTAAHLCRQGRANKKGDAVCINPWHIIFTTQVVNIDQNRCAYGSRQTCPHGNCIWNWSNGQPKNCFNLGSDLALCQCVPKCKHVVNFE